MDRAAHFPTTHISAPRLSPATSSIAPLLCPTGGVPDPPLGPALATLMEESQMLPAVQSKEGEYKLHHRAVSQQCGTVHLVSVKNHHAFAVWGGSSLSGSSSSSLYSQGENHHAENHAFLFPRY